MRPLNAAGILQVWERGQPRPPLDRALTILAAADPEEAWEATARLPIGQRDARLLTLREETLGGRMRAFVECPACKARLTFDLDVSDLRNGAPAAEPGEAFEVVAGASHAWFRLPTTLDLIELLSAPADVAALRRQLAQRCVVHKDHDGSPLPVDALPDEVIDLVSEEMSRRDPQAETTIALTCPDCDHRWSAPFDISTFFWTEIATLASRLLHEVDVLARAYGWREGDILGLSALRRDAYVQLALS